MNSAHVRRAWNRFWFNFGSAENIAAARIIIAGQGLWILLSRDFGAVAGLPAYMWTGTHPAWAWRFLLLPGYPGVESALQWAAVAALACALVGWHTRKMCFAGSILLYHLGPLESIVWTPNPGVRGVTITVLGLLALSWSRCSDRFSIHRPRSASPSDPAAAYSWQLRVIQLFICQIYLFSALAKMRTGGVAWILDENMQRWLIYFNEHPDFARFTTPGLWLAGHATLGNVLAALTVLFEGTFILVMVIPVLTRVFIPTAFAFHIGIVFLMNITFPALPLLLVFVNWEWLIKRCRAPAGVLAAAPP